MLNRLLNLLTSNSCTFIPLLGVLKKLQLAGVNVGAQLSFCIELTLYSKLLSCSLEADMLSVQLLLEVTATRRFDIVRLFAALVVLF
jgi:hypothetical protein